MDWASVDEQGKKNCYWHGKMLDSIIFDNAKIQPILEKYISAISFHPL